MPVSCDIFNVAFYQCFGLRNVGSSEDEAGKCTKLQMNEPGNKKVDHYSAHLVVRFSAAVLETVCIGEEEHGKLWRDAVREKRAVAKRAKENIMWLEYK